jgi:lipid II:glycine glycyltransferase (peptidoglycan interpeptide bridge formation enzyme)
MNIILHPACYGTIDVKEANAKRADECSTHILHLNQPFADIENHRFQSRLRTTIRKSEQKGITIHWSNSKESVESFKNLYQQACERWSGELAVPLHFFDLLTDYDGDDIRIWLAEFENEVIAADVMLYGKNEVQYFTGAMNADYVKLNASKLLMSKVIEDACERNFGLINFGSSAGLEGVEQFKERFGGIKTYYARLVYRHFIFSIC